MEQQFNTSFIPKKSLQEQQLGGDPRSYVRRRSVMGPGYYLSLLILIATILGAVAVFMLTRITIGVIDEQRVQLEERASQFQDELVAEFIRTDARLKSASTLLENHFSVSEMFDLLEQVTLKNVVLDELAYRVAYPQGTIEMALVGRTDTFESIALQLDEYRLNEFLFSPEVNQVERKESEGTSFSMVVGVEPRLVSYVESLSDGRKSANDDVPPLLTLPDAEAQGSVEQVSTEEAPGQQDGSIVGVPDVE